MKLPRPVQLILGYLLLVIGVIGIVAPILPTWIFIIPGVLLLGEESKVGSWIMKRVPAPIKRKFESLIERHRKR